MGDYIYYILVIGWVVYGIIKATSKNNAKKEIESSRPKYTPNVSSTFDKNISSFERLFKDFLPPNTLQEDEMPHPYGAPKHEIIDDFDDYSEKYAVAEKLDSYAGSDNISSVFEQKGILKSKQDHVVQDIENQLTSDMDDNDDEAFDLRQAIIYQVILQRPY